MTDVLDNKVGWVGTLCDVDTTLVDEESGDDYIFFVVSSAWILHGLVICKNQDPHDGYRTFRRIGYWKFQTYIYGPKHAEVLLSQKQMTLLGIKEETFLLM